MILIPDDPIISAMERTGYPPRVKYKWWGWSDDEGCEREDEEDDA